MSFLTASHHLSSIPTPFLDDLLAGGGLLRVLEIFLFPALSREYRSHFTSFHFFLFVCFLFFLLSFVLFGVQSFSCSIIILRYFVSFSQIFCVNISTCSYISNVFVGVGEPHVLILCYHRLPLGVYSYPSNGTFALVGSSAEVKVAIPGIQ